jgi:hypothetical protein
MPIDKSERPDGILVGLSEMFRRGLLGRTLFFRSVFLAVSPRSGNTYPAAWVIVHPENPDELCSEMRVVGAGYGVKIDRYALVGLALV